MSQLKQPVKVYRMPTCPWGVKAVELLKQRNIPFEDILLKNRDEVDEIKTKYNVATTPQVFSGEQRIGGYTDLAEYFKVKKQKAEFSYVPVIAVFGIAALMTLALSLSWMGFMGISLCLLAMLKLMDINGFAASFIKYDLVSKFAKLYAMAYPFIELYLGLSFLAQKGLIYAGWIALIVGIIGFVSVFKAVYIDKMELNCACIGGNSKAPLGVVSLIENLMMIIMGVYILYEYYS